MTAVEVPYLEGVADPGARKAILDAVRAACGVPLSEALEVQARHSGEFMVSGECRAGVIGAACKKTMAV